MVLKRIRILALAFILVAAFTINAMAATPIGDENTRYKINIEGSCLDTKGTRFGGNIRNDKDLRMRLNGMTTDDGVVTFALVTFFLSNEKKGIKKEVGQGKFYFDFPVNYEKKPTGMTIEGGTVPIEKLVPRECDDSADPCSSETNNLINGWVSLTSEAFTPGSVVNQGLYVPEIQATIAPKSRGRLRGWGKATGLPFGGKEINCPTNWRFRERTE